MIIKIEAYENGGHDNQDFHGILPEGWAIIPDGMETANFPFGEVVAEEVDGVMTVTSWVAGVIPAPEPAPAEEPTEMEQLRADVDYIAMEMGVNL